MVAMIDDVTREAVIMQIGETSYSGHLVANIPTHSRTEGLSFVSIYTSQDHYAN